MKPSRDQQKRTRPDCRCNCFGLRSDASRVFLQRRPLLLPSPLPLLGRPFLCSDTADSKQPQPANNPSPHTENSLVARITKQVNNPTSKIYAQQDMKLSDPKQARACWCVLRAHAWRQDTPASALASKPNVHTQADTCGRKTGTSRHVSRAFDVAAGRAPAASKHRGAPRRRQPQRRWLPAGMMRDYPSSTARQEKATHAASGLLCALVTPRAMDCARDVSGRMNMTGPAFSTCELSPTPSHAPLEEARDFRALSHACSDAAYTSRALCGVDL
jgi:hypothetical protein